MGKEEGTGAIRLYRRNLEMVTPGRMARVWYQSNGNSGRPLPHTGEITRVDPVSHDEFRFWMYDDNASKKLEVRIQNTLSQSDIRSKIKKNWQTIGSPVRVLIGDETDSAEDIRQQFLLSKREGVFPQVLVAASIQWNESIVAWYEEAGSIDP